MLHEGTEKSTASTSFYWLHFTLPGKITYVDSQRALLYGTISSNHVLIPKILKLSSPEHLEDLFAQFLHTQEVGYYTPFIFNILVTRMLLEITEQIVNAPNTQSLSKSDILALQVLAWIESHWSLPVTIEDAAVELGFNHDYVGRAFKSYVGTTFQQHINDIRIQKAKVLLHTSSLRVREIAYKVGFRDEKYFIKLFKKVQGISPLQCRRLYHARHENLE